MPTIEYYHPGEFAPHPMNSNQHSDAHIAELADSLETLTQYKNVCVWSPPEPLTIEDKNGKQYLLKPSLKYIIAGHGLVLAAIKRGWDRIEAKDYTGVWDFDTSILAMETDNAAPLGSTRDPEQMAANYERVRALYADRPDLSRMFDRARAMAGVNGELPNEWPEYDEDVENEVEFIECPSCGHKFPK